MQHIFIVGSKGIGQYGGYETFCEKISFYHKDNINLKYHIACKANGIGCMDESKLPSIRIINNREFEFCNTHCYKIQVPEIGSAQAIYYDVAALQYWCKYIEKNHIKEPIVYILTSRVGPFLGHFTKKIHNYGGRVFQNPDGRESLRARNPLIKKYWKLSERLMIKNSDLIICDSKNIEKYICNEYKRYQPKTTYIAYGAELRKSSLVENDKIYLQWLKKYDLKRSNYYLVVGRFVPENNFETMIREFMKSHSEKDFVIVTNVNDKFLNELEKRLHFKKDKRIKFVGTVYQQELLMKIREEAYAYFHGHEVGGTNPSLLESLSSTNLNLLLGVGFNREVAEDAALYWNKEEGDLASLINKVDHMSESEIFTMGEKAKKRIKEAFSWKLIADKYEIVFINKNIL